MNLVWQLRLSGPGKPGTLFFVVAFRGCHACVWVWVCGCVGVWVCVCVHPNAELRVAGCQQQLPGRVPLRSLRHP